MCRDRTTWDSRVYPILDRGNLISPCARDAASLKIDAWPNKRRALNLMWSFCYQTQSALSGRCRDAAVEDLRAPYLGMSRDAAKHARSAEISGDEVDEMPWWPACARGGAGALSALRPDIPRLSLLSLSDPSAVQT